MKTNEARKLLGVAPGAAPQEIKKAFRYLAMLWHPDRNPAPEAGEMFARLSAACDHLLGLSRKAGAGSGADDDDGVHRPAGKAASHGGDRCQDIELDIEHLCLGGQVETVLESRVECPECAGQGYLEHERKQLCPYCQGSGRVRRGKSLFRCEDCDGRGYSKRIRCTKCNGSGQQVSRRVLTVKVPPGVQPGDELRLKGEGHPSTSPKGRPGDLRLRIQARPHPLYALDGSDLVFERPVSVFVLLAGGTVTVPSPGGPRDVELRPGSAAAREQSIPGAGIPARGRRAAGSLRVRFVPVLPAALTPELIELCRALQAGIERAGADSIPELAAWETRWLPDR
ncbi:MAG: DnaJ domain-containing protein [Azoarcus sp.]|nr:DnaJ domain-containing protein [Azoarcus sp.]